jgi:hypothetical protein
MLGGKELLVFIVMALGAAFAVGNLGALVKPRRQGRPGELKRAPRQRSLGMAALGILIFIWGLATLLTQ